MEFFTENNQYHIISQGNGWAYDVTQMATGKNLWFQDDDACHLQAATNNFANEFAIAQYFECLYE